jgi:hypothetical protein
MSEPFNVDADPTSQDQGWTRTSTQEAWEKVQKGWKSVMKQNLRIARKGEAALQLPLIVAIFLGLAFPHMAVIVLLLGLAFGYAFTVDRK